MIDILIDKIKPFIENMCSIFCVFLTAKKSYFFEWNTMVFDD